MENKEYKIVQKIKIFNTAGIGEGDLENNINEWSERMGKLPAGEYFKINSVTVMEFYKAVVVAYSYFEEVKK